MSFVPVPWAVEGGALVGVEGARILAYAATQHADGVMGILDLKVSQLSTPGAGVQVGVGACVVRNRALGYLNQSYIASRPLADDTLPVSANGGASTRCDMVVVSVENPWIGAEPYGAPADPTIGPYVYLRVLPNVGAANIASAPAAKRYLRSLNLSAIPLAGITLPASTASVLNAHLRDLRDVAQPNRYRPGLQTYNLSGTEKKTVTASSYADWFYMSSWQVRVPEWATVMTVRADVVGARLDKQSSSTDGKVQGAMRVQLGRDSNAVYTQGITYDFDAAQNSGATRALVACGDTIAVPAAYRDSIQNLTIQAQETGGNQHLYADSGSAAFVDVEFLESPV